MPIHTVLGPIDADRLDLVRVGIVPNPQLLSTEAGRRMIGII